VTDVRATTSDIAVPSAIESPAAAATTSTVAVPAIPAKPAVPSSPAVSVGELASVSAGAGNEGAPVVEGSKQVVITFNDRSWVDVRDSERKFKLFGEIPKGSRKVLGGQPPYKMVIGDAQAVSIRVNGQPFDLTPYAKGNVARFTLDP
jgi:cytoskeleton protein RodZ